MREKRGKKKKESLEHHCHFSTTTTGRAQRVTSNIIVEVGVWPSMIHFHQETPYPPFECGSVLPPTSASVTRVSLFFFTITSVLIFVTTQIYLK